MQGNNLTGAQVKVKQAGQQETTTIIQREPDGTIADEHSRIYIPIKGDMEFECVGSGAQGTTTSRKSYEFKIKPLSDAEISLDVSPQADSTLCSENIKYSEQNGQAPTTTDEEGNPV